MDYYNKTFFIPKVNAQDEVIGKIERWQAHKQAILHRGFTLVLAYRNNFIIQHRKHPVFDNLFDISSSSHQIYIEDKIQSINQAIAQMLKREWYLDEKNLSKKPVFLGKDYYKAKDSKSIYSEHEICHFYLLDINSLPKYNPVYAYGYSLIKKNLIKNKITNKTKYAPWVINLFRLL